MITIAIPFYNDEKYLEYAIKSVINQTYTDWSLLLIDDGSVDSSLEIARIYAEKDPRINVVSDGDNKGLPYRLNQIAGLTTTKYLARMDSDDIMHPDRIKKQLEILENNPKIDLLGSNAYSIDQFNNIRGVRKKITSKDSLYKTTSFIHPTITGKTKWFKKNPYNMNARRMQDTELWSRTHQHSCFVETQLPLLYYREFGGNYYKKYYQAIKTRIYLFKKFKSKKLLFDIFDNIVKSLIYYTFSLINKEDFLIKTRFKKTSYEEQKRAEKKLKDALLDTKST